MELHRIKWLFFDIGSTLIDETACEEYRRIHGHSRTAYIPWPSELEKPYADAAPALVRLRARYRLGIIANQLPGAAERLARFGLLRFFDVLALSSEDGVSKPDPAIFLLALSRAGCAPQESIMAGDRPDNDIMPAAQLGMGTAWVRRGKYASAGAHAGRRPDLTADDLGELAEMLLSPLK